MRADLIERLNRHSCECDSRHGFTCLKCELMAVLDHPADALASQEPVAWRATDEMVEAAARELYKHFTGTNPDWEYGVDKNGYRQEPFVGTVPGWKWHWEEKARIALVAALFASPVVPVAAKAEAGVREALQALLDHVDRNTCTHETTHRGGFLWTICDDCGQKWADDQGGFVPYFDPDPVANARTILSAAAPTRKGEGA